MIPSVLIEKLTNLPPDAKIWDWGCGKVKIEHLCPDCGVLVQVICQDMFLALGDFPLALRRHSCRPGQYHVNLTCTVTSTGLPEARKLINLSLGGCDPAIVSIERVQ